MDPTPRRRFLKSPHHVWLGLATLGAGLAFGNPLGLLLGAAAYAIGWVYFPDTALFRGWLSRRDETASSAEATARAREFAQRRDAMIDGLSARRRQAYATLVEVCRDVEQANADSGLAAPAGGQDPRLRKLDELVWTYLRLLAFEESLERFLEGERREDLPETLREAEQEALRTERAASEAAAQGRMAGLEAQKRLAASCRERVEVLRKRAERTEQAKQNLAVASAELARLIEQVKLIRADSVASRNADGLSIRLDAAVEHLDETNRWLAEIEDFRDLVGDGPPQGARIGYGPTQPSGAPVREPPARRATPDAGSER